ncbi:hypothetical protein OBBRIDRAFT_833779 [Obba rivulosa]|uniref:Uncharacterized protein n=1 Tax=Obba rivulosa TaxID=1052685 RepID=A0A8E2DNX6_9APHY|nr:hypothetical protein OBBRIDRAFT_833779 [Obba rivulosa]
MSAQELQEDLMFHSQFDLRRDRITDVQLDWVFDYLRCLPQVLAGLIHSSLCCFLIGESFIKDPDTGKLFVLSVNEYLSTPQRPR